MEARKTYCCRTAPVHMLICWTKRKTIKLGWVIHPYIEYSPDHQLIIRLHQGNIYSQVRNLKISMMFKITLTT